MPNYTPDKMPIALPVTRNMNGTEVRKVQMWLNELNDYFQFYPKHKLPESGFYGDVTIKMVKEFQKFCNLAPSGMYEHNTHEWVEFQYMHMFENMEKIRQREAADALFSERKW